MTRPSPRSRPTTRLPLLAGAAAIALGVAACSSTGGRQATQEDDGGGQGAGTPEMTVALVSHGAAGDTFWDQVRAGAEDAAAKDNVRLEYTADPDGSKQANLVQQAIDKDVDGIAVTMAKPDAVEGAVAQAVDADIPVVVLNAGMDDWQDAGALSFFGQDDELAGEAAGERLTKEKAGKALCVIHEQGNVGHEARCAGMKKTFADSERIYVNGKDTANVQSTITAALQKDDDVTHVVTLGAPFALVAASSIEEAGSEARLATFDVNDEALQAIKDGQIEWVVDQQPYVQGYLAVDALWLRVNQGASVGGQQPVYTGPAFVDAGSVDALLEQGEGD